MWPVQCRKIIMEALFLFNVREMIVQSFVNYLSDISSRHFSFLKVIIFFWKRRSQIILASFDIQLNSKKKSRKIDISFSFFEKSWGKKSKIFLTKKRKKIGLVLYYCLRFFKLLSSWVTMETNLSTKSTKLARQLCLWKRVSRTDFKMVHRSSCFIPLRFEKNVFCVLTDFVDWCCFKAKWKLNIFFGCRIC